MTQYKNMAEICLWRHDKIRGNDTCHSNLVLRNLFFDTENEVTEILYLTDAPHTGLAMVFHRQPQKKKKKKRKEKEKKITEDKVHYIYVSYQSWRNKLTRVSSAAGRDFKFKDSTSVKKLSAVKYDLNNWIPSLRDLRDGFGGWSWNPLDDRARFLCATSPSLVSIQSRTRNSNLLPFISLTEI